MYLRTKCAGAMLAEDAGAPGAIFFNFDGQTVSVAKAMFFGDNILGSDVYIQGEVKNGRFVFDESVRNSQTPHSLPADRIGIDFKYGLKNALLEDDLALKLAKREAVAAVERWTRGDIEDALLEFSRTQASDGQASAPSEAQVNELADRIQAGMSGGADAALEEIGDWISEDEEEDAAPAM